MKVLFVFSDSDSEWNCSQWRSLTPSDAINKYGEDDDHSATLMKVGDFEQFGHPLVQEMTNEHDVIIVQRNLLTEQIHKACDYWRNLGKLVCADLDDDYPRLTPQNPAHRFWLGERALVFKEEFGMMPIEALTEGLRHVDALLSPSQLILDDWSEIVPGYILRNYAQDEWYEGIEQKGLPGPDDDIVIGWGGSVSHYDSWIFSGLVEAMSALFDAFPRVKVKICGNDWRLLQAVEAAWPTGRWIHQKGVPPSEWPKQVASFDIGVAPLAGPEAPKSELYDNHRSHLKAAEYIICGVPWIASPGPVYEELDGIGGHRVGTNDQVSWFYALGETINLLESRKAASAALMKWGRENLTIQHNVQTYIDLFTRIRSETTARKGIKLPDIIYVADLMEADMQEGQDG